MTLRDELYLCQRLKDHGGLKVHDGPTDYPIRKDRMRKLIVDAGLADAIALKRNDKPVTYRAEFERIYQEPL